jgi:hypothetical protein
VPFAATPSRMVPEALLGFTDVITLHHEKSPSASVTGT